MKQAAIGIVFNKKNHRVILVKRRDIPIWVLPGGGIDANESPEEAVIREVFEETGLVVKITRKTGEYTPINRLSQTTHVFECEVISGSMQLSDETRDINEFSCTQTPQSFFFIHKVWLNDAMLGLSAPVKKEISQVTYFNLFRYFLRHPIHVFRFLLTRLGLR